jgi:hypothetical protein
MANASRQKRDQSIFGVNASIPSLKKRESKVRKSRM